MVEKRFSLQPSEFSVYPYLKGKGGIDFNQIVRNQDLGEQLLRGASNFELISRTGADANGLDAGFLTPENRELLFMRGEKLLSYFEINDKESAGLFRLKAWVVAAGDGRQTLRTDLISKFSISNMHLYNRLYRRDLFWLKYNQKLTRGIDPKDESDYYAHPDFFAGRFIQGVLNWNTTSGIDIQRYQAIWPYWSINYCGFFEALQNPYPDSDELKKAALQTWDGQFFINATPFKKITGVFKTSNEDVIANFDRK